MNAPGAPLRYLALALALWIGVRGLWLWGDQPHIAPIFAQHAGMPAPIPASLKIDQPAFHPKPAHTIKVRAISPSSKISKSGTLAWADLGIGETEQPQKPDGVEKSSPHAPSPGIAYLPSIDAPDSRWSASVWLFARNGKDGQALATSGQLGGSQMGGRIRWRINPDGPTRAALTARISTPLQETHGAEAAIGAEVHPLPGKPLWVAVERRVAIGSEGRNAWSAYAAGGIWKPNLPGGAILEGYAQAGMVGAHSRDFFADGALRLGKPVLGENGPRVGGGVWAAAQPNISRIDVGPQVTVPISVAQQPLSISVDLRMRVAGNASPGTGIAVTLGADF